MISSLRKYKYIIQIFIFSKGKVHGKCAPKHTKLHNSGEHAPEPPWQTRGFATRTLHGANANTPTFTKIF